MTPPEAEITELPSSPGARLKREREASGLSEQQAAESLNLDPTVITVLEANDFAALGAPVFAKGHLRRYAALLGLDEDEIVGAYERSKQHIDEPTLVPRARIEMAPVRGRPRWPWVFGGTAAFLVAALLLAYLSERGLPWSDDAAEETAATDTAVETTQSLPTQAPGAVPDDASAGTTAVDPAAAPSGVSLPGDAAAGSVAPGPGQVSLQLRFTGDSWVEIFDGSGKAVLYDLGKTGTERTITATAPLSVTLGNASAVAIAVNGRALPPPPAQGPVARFSVGADGALR
jgi:cytoskeleton protein RodZ